MNRVGTKNPSAIPSWFPKTPRLVAVEISEAGNQSPAIFGGSVSTKHSAKALKNWASMMSQKRSGLAAKILRARKNLKRKNLR